MYPISYFLSWSIETRDIFCKKNPAFREVEVYKLNYLGWRYSPGFGSSHQGRPYWHQLSYSGRTHQVWHYKHCIQCSRSLKVYNISMLSTSPCEYDMLMLPRLCLRAYVKSINSDHYGLRVTLRLMPQHRRRNAHQFKYWHGITVCVHSAAYTTLP